jgi:hypothetical protein
MEILAYNKKTYLSPPFPPIGSYYLILYVSEKEIFKSSEFWFICVYESQLNVPWIWSRSVAENLH